MRKILVASGDSWTAGTKIEDKQYKFWPNILAKKLGWKVLNVGRGGAGYEFIYNSIVDTLSKTENVGLAICLWSHFDRWDFPEQSFKVNPKNPKPFGGYTSVCLAEKRQKVLDAVFKNNLASDEYNLYRSLRWFNAFQNYCKCNDVPYIQTEAFYPTYLGQTNLIHNFIDHPLFDSILEKHFLGWPIYREIGGKTMWDKLNEVDPTMTKLRVSALDTHPSDEGHEYIAEFLYDKYKEIYL